MMSVLQETNDELISFAKIQIVILCRHFLIQSMMVEFTVKSEFITVG